MHACIGAFLGGSEMDVYDPSAVRAVWERVLAPQALDERTLTEWIAKERASYRAYRNMARRSRKFASQFLKMADEEAAHARRLIALYFLLFGHRAQVFPAAADTQRAFGAALRVYYQGETQARDTYRSAAAQWKEHAALFSAIAEDENRHAQTLQKITAAYL